MPRKYAHVDGELQEIYTLDELAKEFGMPIEQLMSVMVDAGMATIENGVFRPSQMAIETGMAVDSHGNRWGGEDE